MKNKNTQNERKKGRKMEQNIDRFEVFQSRSLALYRHLTHLYNDFMMPMNSLTLFSINRARLFSYPPQRICSLHMAWILHIKCDIIDIRLSMHFCVREWMCAVHLLLLIDLCYRLIFDLNDHLFVAFLQLFFNRTLINLCKYAIYIDEEKRIKWIRAEQNQRTKSIENIQCR